jgi:hypothetical protein
MSCRLRRHRGRRSWKHAQDKRAAGARTGCADGRLTAPRLRVRQLPMNKPMLQTSYRSSLSRVEIAAIRTFPAHVFFCSLLRVRLSKRLAYFQQKSWGISFLGISRSSDNFGVEMRLPSWTCRLANGVGKDGGADEGSQNGRRSDGGYSRGKSWTSPSSRRRRRRRGRGFQAAAIADSARRYWSCRPSDWTRL